MRFIDMSKFQPGETWLNKAKILKEKLENATSGEERKKVFESNIWTDLKEEFEKLSYGKCWFSDVKELFSHLTIEHYRPKSKSKDLDGNECEGYWWLAYDWKNFRLCGTVGNTKKGSFFPLLDETRRACSSRRNTADELPMLLDPAKMSDCCLITFNSLGKAISIGDISGDQEKRVSISVKRYALDYPKLEEARKTLWESCENLLNEIANLMKENATIQSCANDAKIEEKMRHLRQLTKEDQPLSSIAKICLTTSGYDWAKKLAC